MYTNLCVYMYTIYVYTYVKIYIHIHIDMYTYMHIYTYMYMYMYMCMYTPKTSFGHHINTSLFVLSTFFKGASSLAAAKSRDARV